MPDPAQGPQGPQGPQDPSAQFSNLQRLVSEYASAGGQALDVVNRKAEEVQVAIQHAVEQMVALGKAGGEASSKTRKELSSYIQQLKDVEKIHRNYYAVISSEEDKKTQGIRDKLRQQTAAVRAEFALQLEAAKDNKDRVLKLRQEESEQIAILKKKAQKEQYASAMGAIGEKLLPGGVGGMLAPLAGLASLSSLLSMVVGGLQAQYKAGGAAGRVTGQEVSLEAGQKGIDSFLGSTAAMGLGLEKSAEIMNTAFAQAPQLASQHLEPAIASMAMFGITVEESVKMITDASARAGTTAKQFNDNWAVAVNLVRKFKDSGIDVGWAARKITDFSAALVQTGVNSAEANQQAQVWVTSLASMKSHLKLTTEQMEPFVQNLGGVISSMSPEKAYGLMLATQGAGRTPSPGSPNFLKDMGSAVSSPQFLKGIGDFVSKSLGPQYQGFAPSKVGEMLGMNLNMLQAQEMGDLLKRLGTKATVKDLAKEGFQSDSANIQSIAKNIMANQTVMDSLKKFLEYWIGKEVLINSVLIKQLGQDSGGLADTLKGEAFRHQGHIMTNEEARQAGRKAMADKRNQVR